MIQSAVESFDEPSPGLKPYTAHSENSAHSALPAQSAAESSFAGAELITLERLATLGADTEALVDSVDGDSALHRRLLESGFTAGIGVRFVMATPFGDPLVFALRGASIALRKNEARCVRVRVQVSTGNGRAS